MLKEEMEWVKEIARTIAREEIALANATKLTKVKLSESKPEPAVDTVEAEALTVKSKRYA